MSATSGVFGGELPKRELGQVQEVDFSAIEKEIISDLSYEIFSYDFGNKI
jgi:hypothetical protein